MKLLLSLSILLLSNSSFSQTILGDWYGKLKVSGIELRIILHVSETDSGLVSTLDSPDQGAKDVPMTSTYFINDTLTIESKEMKAVFVGVFVDSILIGTYSQRGRDIPLKFSRKIEEEIVLVRPQEPTGKVAYKEIEVSFKNDSDNVTLSGTLTVPKGRGPFKTVILISGSGPQNRNEEILGHKPFLVIADHLTKNGIAVLRFDDRGVGKSTGDFGAATSVEFARDVEAALKFLKTQKNIDSTKIGLIGHSEGGLIAPMVASKPENAVAFIILLAGPGIRGDEIIYKQQALIAKANGSSDEEIAKNDHLTRSIFTFLEKNLDNSELNLMLHSYIDSLITADSLEIPKGVEQIDLVKAQVAAVSSPWMKFFLFHNPAEDLKKVKCPVLALNGSLDLQVPPKEDLATIKKAIESNGNKNVTTLELEGLNHLFQTAKTGSPSEYAEISETFSPEALKIMSDWLKENVK